jgi:septal ring factor EnvC (AmiA/AmiB activator)
MLRNQAVFVSHLDEDRQRFARIERSLDEITALLRQHDQILKQHDQTLTYLRQMLKDLPAAIQKKIGFEKN